MSRRKKRAHDAKDPPTVAATTPTPAEDAIERPLSVIGSPDGELIGWYDRDYIYLLPSVSYNHVAKFARDEGRPFGIKEHALRKALADEGILVESDEGHYTVPKRINGQVQRVIVLLRSAVEKHWGIPGEKR